MALIPFPNPGKNQDGNKWRVLEAQSASFRNVEQFQKVTSSLSEKGGLGKKFLGEESFGISDKAGQNKAVQFARVLALYFERKSFIHYNKFYIRSWWSKGLSHRDRNVQTVDRLLKINVRLRFIASFPGRTRRNVHDFDGERVGRRPADLRQVRGPRGRNQIPNAPL